MRHLLMDPAFPDIVAEWAADRRIDLAASSVTRLLVAGEPGGGEPELRARLEAAWGARVTEAMGIGDVAVSLWGECEAQAGMHFSGRGFVHVELIDPDTGTPRPFADGATGELVYTHLSRRAAPLLRFRSRDRVRVERAQLLDVTMDGPDRDLELVGELGGRQTAAGLEEQEEVDQATRAHLARIRR